MTILVTLFKVSIMQCEVQRFVHLDHVEEIMKLIGSRFVRIFEKSQKWKDELVPLILKKLRLIET